MPQQVAIEADISTVPFRAVLSRLLKRRPHRALALEMCLMFATAFWCHAQNRRPLHVISGSVHDPSEAAIVDASVELVLPDGRVISQTRTDTSGNFRFAGIEDGNYRLEAQHEGFKLTA